MKWEYKVVFFAWGETPWEQLIGQISAELNRLGQQGWELVSQVGHGTLGQISVLKRPISK
jgi:hypothetical protein